MPLYMCFSTSLTLSSSTGVPPVTERFSALGAAIAQKTCLNYMKRARSAEVGRFFGMKYDAVCSQSSTKHFFGRGLRDQCDLSEAPRRTQGRQSHGQLAQFPQTESFQAEPKLASIQLRPSRAWLVAAPASSAALSVSAASLRCATAGSVMVYFSRQNRARTPSFQLIFLPSSYVRPQ